ncbi:MAG: aspartate aminotransferase family protein [Proteobacteria bacterium]|nr:aspartate aminotransferase family protein [Pseudomonadota bacterium]
MAAKDHLQKNKIYSGATPDEVEKDLLPLVNFVDEGLEIEEVRSMIRKKLVPHLIKYDRKEFQSMFNSYPEEGAELGAQISLGFNQGVTNWQVSPGGAQLEELCCERLCRLFDLPRTAGATFMYSGTYANQEAIYLALHRKAEHLGFNLATEGISGFSDPSKLFVLTSKDAHFSVKQAVRMLGLGDRNLVLLDLDSNRRIDLKHLKSTMDELKSVGEIVCIVATTGTTSTGSIDPVKQISELSEKHNCWLHVDGAYGLAYSLVPEYKDRFSGIELADSISWDPHKQMGVPIPNSVLFLKNELDFKRISSFSHYFNRKDDPEPNPGIKSPPSTRPMAVLPLVSSILFQGLHQVKKRLRTPLEGVEKLAEYLKQENQITTYHTPDTGILCFQIRPEGVAAEQLNDLQKAIYRKISAEGVRSISITQLDNDTVLRLLAISPAVTFSALKESIKDIKEKCAWISDKKNNENTDN